MSCDKVRYRQRRNIIESSVKAVEKRSKGGCLTCRKRHKKCNEQKPICSSCKENFLSCTWTDKVVNNEPKMFLSFHINDWKVQNNIPSRKLKLDLPSRRNFMSLTIHDNSIAKIEESLGDIEKLKRFPTVKELDSAFEPLPKKLELTALHPPIFDESTFWLSRQVTPHLTDSLTISNSSIKKAISESEPQSLKDEALKGGSIYNYLFDDTHPLAQKFESIIQSLNAGDLSLISKNCTDELFLLYAAVKHWLYSQGPQDTHPLLTTQATFTRNFENNNVLKEVFLCCGATFMEYYDTDLFSKLSSELYESSLTLMKKVLEESSEESNKPWLLASYQLLCLRNKAALNSTVNDCVSCLTSSYQIIKSPYYLSKIKSLGTTDEKYVEELVLEMEHDTSIQKPKLEPHDRMYLESFIYNYSVAILWAIDISKLPNPYSVYEVLRKSLKCFIYQCDVRWMNNPIFGASSEAFEILAKVSYIARLPMPLDKETIWFKRAIHLQKQANYYTPSILPRTDPAAMEDKVYQNCKMNLLVGKVVAKASFLLVSKIIFYNDFNILSCQDVVSEIVQSIEKIPKDYLIWGILTWPVVVCGVFTADPENQKKILSFLDYIRDRFHMLPLFNAKLFLFRTWELPLNDRLNILFDRQNMTWVNT